MAKGRIKIVMEYDYDIVPDNYPPGSSTEEMIATDVDNFESDPLNILDCVDDCDVSISGEVIEE